jgi:VCBS repeat-containing protein
MDAYFGDHNPYTKFNYGWLTNSRLVVANDTLTLSLEDFSKNGDTIIIANNWDESLGAYQEYYVLMYYKNTGLNGDGFGYFEKEGVLVYHVNASLYKEMLDGETYYAVYNTNTNEDDPNGYGTKDNLIEFVLSAKGNYVYGAGDRISATTKDDQGNKIAYTFTVDSLTSNSATITFKKNA